MFTCNKPLDIYCQKLSEKQPHIDSAIQCVRDIFAMNTKSLNQMREQVHYTTWCVEKQLCMADTGFNYSKDLRNHIWNFSLSL